MTEAQVDIVQYLLKDFMINIMLIFTPIVFYPYLHKNKTNPKRYKFIVYLLFAIALAASMTFPVAVSGVVYDFRSVPLALGMLNGGPVVGGGLYLTAVMYRLFMNDPHTGLYAASLLAALSAAYLLFGRRFRLNRSLYRNVLVSVAACIVIKLIASVIYLFGTHPLQDLIGQPLWTLHAYWIEAAMIAFYVCLIHLLDRYYDMQEELIQSEKANIVSHIAASVAHEIRNPLTSVRGFIQLFGNESLEADKRKYYQQLCLEELDRAQSIISDYLALAKSDPEVVEPLNVQDEVHYVSSVLHSYALFSNTEIIRTYPPSSNLYINGDRNKFRQALINIGKNAIEAMPGGGVLEIKVEKTDRSITIAFNDTGHGMSPEQIRRLGTPYYSTKEKGTGLGTMVSFNIIHTMNGKIHIESEVGKGTSFQIVFPASSGANLQREWATPC